MKHERNTKQKDERKQKTTSRVFLVAHAVPYPVQLRPLGHAQAVEPLLLIYVYTYIYIYICTHTYTYLSIHVYIYIQRERQIQRYRERDVCFFSQLVYYYYYHYYYCCYYQYVYIYIYIYMYMILNAFLSLKKSLSRAIFRWQEQDMSLKLAQREFGQPVLRSGHIG